MAYFWEIYEAQKEIYNLVLESQIAAINECKVGNPYNAPHDKARQVLAEGLIKLGVINQSLEESLDLILGFEEMVYAQYRTLAWT